MQHELPYWVSILSALATPTLACLGLLIASRQYSLGRAKLKLDLFEKRYAVYSSIQKVLANIATQGAFNASLDNPILALDIGTKDAAFLFDDDIATFIDNVRTRISKLVYHAKMANKDPPAADYQLHVDRELEYYTAIQEDFRVVQEKFAPYLNFKKLNTFF